MKKLGLCLIFALLLVSLATPVLADGPSGDVVIFGDDYTLESGQKIRGDLLVYGGNADLKAGSEVSGSVTVFGGNVTIAGSVDGDVTVWGGNVSILSEATVRGKVMSVGGKVQRQDGADVRGDEIEGWPVPPIAPVPPIPRATRMVEPRATRMVEPVRPRLYLPSRHNDWLKAIGGLFRSAFSILVLIVLGVLVVVFIPRHTETVAETMVKAPMESFVAGLGTFVVGAIGLLVIGVIAAILMATVCLAPLGLLLLLPFLAVGVGVLFGWIAAGLLLGVKVLRAVTHREPNHVAAVAIGLLLLTLLSAIPCVGWVIAVAVVIWSTGAVAYSLFGTRSHSSTFNFSGTTPANPPSEPGHDRRLDQE